MKKDNVTVDLAGTILKCEERNYKAKDGTQKTARQVTFITDFGEYMVFAYNNLHEEFDFKMAAELFREPVYMELSIIGDRFNYNKPAVVATGFRRVDS